MSTENAETGSWGIIFPLPVHTFEDDNSFMIMDKTDSNVGYTNIDAVRKYSEKKKAVADARKKMAEQEKQEGEKKKKKKKKITVVEREEAKQNFANYEEGWGITNDISKAALSILHDSGQVIPMQDGWLTKNRKFHTLTKAVAGANTVHQWRRSYGPIELMSKQHGKQ